MVNNSRKLNDNVVSAGLDWITVTQVDGPEKAEMYSVVKRMKKHLELQEHSDKDWSAMGYNGFSVGPLKYGERGDQESILIVSGPEAQRFSFEPEIEPERVTRLDIQVTLKWDKPDHAMASKIHKDLEVANDHRRRKMYLNLHQSFSGDTLYVGHRGANVSLRFYDKSFDMSERELGTCWRYEVMFRGTASKKAYARLSRQTEPILHSIGVVAAEYEKRGVLARFGSGTKVDAIQVGRTVTTKAGQIEWLEKCVAPVVSQLCLLGYEEAVINALSLRGIMKFIKDGE